MSSKKIFAASLAAILATGSIAAVALADEPTGDTATSDDTVVISGLGLGAEQINKATISLKGKTGEMTDDWLKVENATDQTKNAYNKIKVGLWEAFEDFDIQEMSNAKIGVSLGALANYEVAPFVNEGGMGGLTQTDKYGKVPAVKLADGTEAFPAFAITQTDKGNTAGSIALTWVDKDGKAVTAPTITGYTAPTPGTTNGGTAADANTDLTADDVKKFIKTTADALWAGASVDDDNAAGLATKQVDVWAEAKLEGTWRKATADAGVTDDTAAPGTGAGATKGYSFGPVQIEAAFDLAAGERLAKDTAGTGFANLKWANWQVEGDFTVSGNTYTKYIDGKYGVGGAYNWTNTGWSDQGASFVYTDSAGTKYGLAVIAQSDVKSSAKIGLQIPDNLTKEPVVDKSKGDLKISKDGAINLFYGGPVNPEVLKKLNNGGTVTFELKEEIPGDQYMLGNLNFLGGKGNYFIDVAHSYTISGKSISFEFPAGLTEHAGDKDPWGDFLMEWDIRTKGVSGLGSAFEDGAPAPTAWDDSIVSITFKANAEAPKDDPTTSDDPTNSDDPANSDTNTSGDNNSGDANTSGDANNSGNGANSGSNKGDNNGNPPTGVALAIAPVVLAAGAVATVIAKKKK